MIITSLPGQNTKHVNDSKKDEPFSSNNTGFIRRQNAIAYLTL